MQQNIYYNRQEDYFVCPRDQHMKRTKNTTRESGSRFVSQTAIYKAKRCKDCPLRCLCHESKDNREIEVNHVLREYRQKARERLVSEEELKDAK